ncbi:MFS transporter [Undibacterium luofuense]|uniref:MFS transporter n=1 Tax=Undibacterium luofuense TaxID=2828733 RepID=A0A941DIV7_9BURK|nr:MFS transporter [Undibacterium luofuense]MBR7781573.1 MFS transporter [Undibacterium luofuense]
MAMFSLLRRYPALRWLWLIQLVSMAAMEMSGPFWTLHLQQHSGLRGTALSLFSALVYAGPVITAMLCTPLWGKLGDKTGHRWMLLRALAALVLTQAWLAICTDPFWIAAIRLLQGAIAGFIAASQAYGSGITQKAQRQPLMAALQVATAAGSVLGPLAGGLLYGQLGLAAVNWLAAALCLLCIPAAWFCLPDIRPPARSLTSVHEPQQPQTAWQWRDSALPGLLAGIVLIQSAKTLPQSYFALYVSEVLHQDTRFTGLAYGLTAAGLCLAAPLWADAFARWNQAQIRQRLVLLCLASATLMLVQSLWLTPLVFLTCRLLWGVLLGALLPVFYSLISAGSPHSAQGLALALGNSAAKAGALAGTAAGALMMLLIPLHALFYAVAAAYLLTAVCLLYLPVVQISDEEQQHLHFS